MLSVVVFALAFVALLSLVGVLVAVVRSWCRFVLAVLSCLLRVARFLAGLGSACLQCERLRAAADGIDVL